MNWQREDITVEQFISSAMAEKAAAWTTVEYLKQRAVRIGNAYSGLGEQRRALECYEQALQIHREVGNRDIEGRVLGNKGATKFELGENEEGVQLVEQALEIARQVEDKVFEEAGLETLKEMRS